MLLFSIMCWVGLKVYRIAETAPYNSGRTVDVVISVEVSSFSKLPSACSCDSVDSAGKGTKAISCLLNQAPKR